jgi:hypothetical protein
VLATVLLQANHASESWFNKDDVKNVVAHQAPRDTDCHNLVKALIQRHSEDPQFRYKVLLYKDYIKLPGAVPYGHDPDDFMAAVWAEPRQVAMGLAHTYTLSWDATHKTNWLGLKYFDFTTIDDLAMLSLVAQGLQRHEDNATSGWILEAVTLDFIPSR